MQPRTRSSRHAFASKDDLEKARLRHRSGGFFRYEEVRDPLAVASSSPGYLRRSQWMTAGPACEELNHAERESASILRDERTEVRRSRSFAREELHSVQRSGRS
ncbi:unnamed protein product [Polarella glacialis]|uniref:Uncharacterized protein n=1 Tax=Polarella glacialis TaxID=89957 RepID=A0A813HHU0_POLGL|nr:unnamed protein product [Polarella glacialis]